MQAGSLGVGLAASELMCVARSGDGRTHTSITPHTAGHSLAISLSLQRESEKMLLDLKT